LKPDLVILAVTLRRGNGIALIKEFRSVAPRLPVLVLSGLDEAVYAERALRRGRGATS